MIQIESALDAQKRKKKWKIIVSNTEEKTSEIHQFILQLSLCKSMNS